MKHKEDLFYISCALVCICFFICMCVDLVYQKEIKLQENLKAMELGYEQVVIEGQTVWQKPQETD